MYRISRTKYHTVQIAVFTCSNSWTFDKTFTLCVIACKIVVDSPTLMQNNFLCWFGLV